MRMDGKMSGIDPNDKMWIIKMFDEQNLKIYNIEQNINSKVLHLKTMGEEFKKWQVQTELNENNIEKVRKLVSSYEPPPLDTRHIDEKIFKNYQEIMNLRERVDQIMQLKPQLVFKSDIEEFADSF